MKNKDINNKLSKIKLLVMDIDGTLTDGSMYYSEKGEELKRFFVKDGMGIVLLKKAGIKTAFLTSENSEIAAKRAEKLNIDEVILGSNDKTTDLKKIISKYDLYLENIAYIGDDINDLHAIKIAGFSACPKDSVDIIKQSVDYICNKRGGRGAVREVCELILISQNKPITIFENW
jgi:3-deoxy-D-manno-octulosonate 8-phosphate phosphatase (KDO 8-P phosphatase)